METLVIGLLDLCQVFKKGGHHGTSVIVYDVVQSCEFPHLSPFVMQLQTAGAKSPWNTVLGLNRTPNNILVEALLSEAQNGW